MAITLLFVPEWGTPAMGLGLLPPRTPLQRLRAGLLERASLRMWRQGLPAFNAARAEHGLAPFTEPAQLLAHWDRLLVTSSAALEPDTFAPPPHVRLVGARVDDPSWAEPWTPPAGDDPLVLVGPSSSYMQQEDVLARITAALRSLPVRGLVTTGPAIDPAVVPAAPNVAVVRSAPHAAVLRHAAAVVTHAGHGTVAKALAAGVPVLALPLGRDQHDIAARVVHRGAGLRLDRDAPPDRIAGAVRRLLGDPRFAAGAARVAAVMADEAREDRAVAELEALVHAG
jgi:MGT family glycosyltransferase